MSWIKDQPILMHYMREIKEKEEEKEKKLQAERNAAILNAAIEVEEEEEIIVEERPIPMHEVKKYYEDKMKTQSSKSINSILIDLKELILMLYENYETRDFAWFILMPICFFFFIRILQDIEEEIIMTCVTIMTFIWSYYYSRVIILGTIMTCIDVLVYDEDPISQSLRFYNLNVIPFFSKKIKKK